MRKSRASFSWLRPSREVSLLQSLPLSGVRDGVEHAVLDLLGMLLGAVVDSFSG